MLYGNTRPESPRMLRGPSADGTQIASTSGSFADKRTPMILALQQLTKWAPVCDDGHAGKSKFLSIDPGRLNSSPRRKSMRRVLPHHPWR